jgi:hypothetical protein
MMMKFEEGKFYRCRDGGKAVVWMLDNGEGLMLGAVLCDDGKWANSVWHSRGLSTSERHNDLVAEWREPFKITSEGWVNRNMNYERDFEWDVFSLRPFKHNKTELCDIKVRITVEEIANEI